MALPVYDPTLHDIGIDGVGYMRAASREGTIQRQDAAPATSRAAAGEGRYDTFQTESFVAQVDWSGGQGQRRLIASDAYLTGYGDTRYPGMIFPARKALTESDGGTTSSFINRDTTLYGFTDTAIETIGTATSQARTAGALACKPVTSGTGAAFWVQDNSGTNALFRWSGTGASSNVTPANITPYLVARYGKWMWLLGKRVRPADPDVVQSTQTSTLIERSSLQLSWAQPFTSGNLALAVIFHKSEAGVNLTVQVTPYDPQWTVLDTSDDWTILMIEGAESRPGTERFDFNYKTSVAAALIEIEGVRSEGALDISVYATGTATSGSIGSNAPSTGTLSQAKNFVLSIWDASISSASISGATPGGGFTELVDRSRTSSSTRQVVNYRVTSSTASVQDQVTFTGTGTNTFTWGSVILVFKGVGYTDPLDQFTVHYTEDDGATWIDASPLISTGIGQPLAALAAQGFLWFTTATGLYQMSAEERTFEDHTSEVIVGIRGPLDAWTVPYDSGAVGSHLTTFEGLFYYNVGATLRRYAPGGTGQQIWPPPDWATVTGKVTAVTAGEGGVYFGAAGYLWVYNTRGFHALAKEPATGTFDTLYWHQGRLYCKGDPARYLDFQYPSTRPDMVSTASDTFETAYVVSSEMDFEKVNVVKIIRQFELHGFFTAGATAAESGTITLHYLTGCDGLADPGQLGGAADTLDWVEIGSFSVADGSGTKKLTLATPLLCKRLFLRLTVTPGTLGYPVPLGTVVYGRAIMPSLKRITPILGLTTATVDRSGASLYPTDADVKAAVDKLLDLRENGTYFTCAFRDEIGGDRAYLVSAELLNDWLTAERGDDGMGWIAQFSMTEIP